MALCKILDDDTTQLVNDSHTDHYFTEIMCYINAHYFENISITDIATHIHISTSYIRRICIQKAKKSPQELISQKRINVAKSMLSNSTASITDIAYFVVFSGQPAFSKFFTQNCGMSAQAYHQQQFEIRQKNAENIARIENNWRADEERRLKNISKSDE